MLVIAVWPLVFAVIGVLIYALSSNAKVAEIGRLTFVVGLLWLVYTMMAKVLHVG